ncbi:MAG: glycosyltransferase family 2 protein, partial [Methanothrix sp.]|nr:glycosyltransferase family 2 protein [Methanothrix sp.]
MRPRFSHSGGSPSASPRMSVQASRTPAQTENATHVVGSPGSAGRPLVSVIISNFNGRDLLCRCLNSLRQLHYPKVEVIVVDAGSTDGTPEMVLADFPEVRLVREKRVGIAEALNIGIRKSNGSIVVFELNNDDVVSPGWLDPLVDTVLRSQEVGVAGGKRYMANTDRIEEAGGRIFLGLTLGRGWMRRDSKKYNTSREVDYVSVLAVRREIFTKIGLLDETYFIGGDDVDFCLRVRRAG